MKRAAKLLIPLATLAMFFVMIELGIYTDESITDIILAFCTLVATCILGAVTYVQTEQQMRIDIMEKIPYLSLVDIDELEDLPGEFEEYQPAQQLIEQNDYEANLPVQDYRSVYVVVRDSRKDSTSKISIKMAVKNISSTPITKVNIYTVIDDKMSLSKIRRKIDVMADKHETINDYSEEMKFWIQHFYEKREVYKKCGITDDNGFSDLLPDACQTFWVDRELSKDDKIFDERGELVAFEITVVFQIVTVYNQTYYQVSELKIYADKLGNGVNIYKIAKNNSQTYTDKEFKKIAKKNNW